MVCHKKSIWIINQYAGTPQTNNPSRHYFIGNVFKRLGYDVTIITASFTHGRKINEVFKEYLVQEYEGLNYIWIKVPEYKKNHGFGRISNWFIFALKLAQISKLDLKKPDVIYYSSLSLIGYLGAEKLKLKYKVPLIFEVRDIWPLTLQELKSLSNRNPLVFFLKKIELRAYKNADILVSNLSNFQLYLDEQLSKKRMHIWIPNGFDSVHCKDRGRFNIQITNQNDSFKVGYAGSLGIANKMEVFIQAANMLKHKKNIEFFILGDGPMKRKLQLLSENRNIHFIDKIPKDQVHCFLETMDCCYIGWNDSSLYKYGIGANKLSDYIQIKKPIIHSYSGNGDPVTKFDIGITIPSNNAPELVKAILEVQKYEPSKIDNIKKNCELALNKFYDYSTTITLLENRVKALIG